MTTMLAGSVPTLMSRSISNDLWAFQIPPLEKVLRTVLVYLAILVIVRVAGKRPESCHWCGPELTLLR